MKRRLAAKTTRIGSLKTISADIPTGSLKTPNTDIPTAIGCAASLRTLFTKQPENEFEAA